MDNNRYVRKKPVIKVNYNDDIREIGEIYQVLLGMEEEGIPFEISPISSGNATQIGYKASLESPLGVGIGIDTKNIVLHFNKLEEDNPIFIIDFKSSWHKKRSLGANAARLVTKMPFKEI